MTSTAAVLVLLCVAQVFASTPELEAIAETNSKFSRDFFKTLSDVSGNLVSSPLSAHLALSMTQLGARGKTASDMSTGLHLPADAKTSKAGFKQLTSTLHGENNEGISLKIANRMFVKSEYELQPEFVTSSRDAFDAEPQAVDFSNPDASRDVINTWVETQTQNKIKDLIQKGILTPDSRLVLVNAVYFNGNWLTKFTPGDTYPRDFYETETRVSKVPMMNMENGFKFAELQDLDAKLIELPYEGNKMSFVIMLPNTRTGLSDLEKKMETSDLSALVNSAPSKNIKLYLPKFKIESSIDLKDSLTKMGMGGIFEDNADFSGIATSEQLQVSKVLQKTFIQVAENGTEAASATYVSIHAVSAPINPPPRIVVDHPFLFYIVHKTTQTNNAVLFSGRVTVPKGFETKE